LIGALLALIPGQPAPRLGLMLMLLWLPTWGVPTTLQLRELTRRQYLRFSYSFWRLVLYQFATLPLLLAGLSRDKPALPPPVSRRSYNDSTLPSTRLPGRRSTPTWTWSRSRTGCAPWDALR
jgi:hypothetical protein